MISSNVTGLVGLEALIQHSAVKNAQFVAVQEHHQVDTCASWESKLRKTGWRGRMEPAVSTGRGVGTSGGILQMVPVAQGLAPVDLIPPSICGGRAVALHTPGVVPGGFLWITLYLHDSEQLSPRNWQILEA
eukprot:3874667-Pyramimonas_sp.AAC.1